MSRDLTRAPLTRCLAVWLVVTSAAGGLAAAVAPRLGTPGPSRFDEALVAVCEVALLLCAAWAWLATGAVALDAARGRLRGRRGVPECVRRAVLAACGVALVGGLAHPAQADGTQRDRQAPTALVHGIPLPDRASAVGHVSRLVARHAERVGARPAGAVVVRPGDTLWDLAEQHLGQASAWPELHRANRAVVGADPDLIHPGQRLVLPRREETR